MRKKILAAITMLAASAMMFSTASAEHASADRYRQMFRDGKFYVEYQAQRRSVNKKGKESVKRSTPIAIAAENGNRVRRIVKSNIKRGFGDKLFDLNPDSSTESESASAEENLMMKYFEFANDRLDSARTSFLHEETTKSGNRKYPEVILLNGKYYQFLPESYRLAFTGGVKIGKMVAYVLPADQLDSPDLEPAQYWDFVERDLAVPQEIAIFCWDSIYHYNPLKQSAPQFVESSKKDDLDCDTYVLDIKNMAGDVIAQWKYNVLYNSAGDLVQIQKYFIRNGHENLARELLIQEFTNEIPDTAFSINQKVKLYDASIGTMSDLLEQPEQIGEFGVDK